MNYKAAAAIQTLMSMTIEKLIEVWNELNKQQISDEVITVRGWIMDALEAKNPEAFDKWIDQCESNDNLEAYFLA
jgi:hypothetical protein